jgi:hypothetical protein
LHEVIKKRQAIIWTNCVQLLSISRLADIRLGMISITNEILPNAVRVLEHLALQLRIGKDRAKMLSKDQKRYNREILYHYPIIPYGD